MNKRIINFILALGVLATSLLTSQAFADQNITSQNVEDFTATLCRDAQATPAEVIACTSVEENCKNEAGKYLRNYLIKSCGLVTGTNYTWVCSDAITGNFNHMVQQLAYPLSSPSYVKASLECQANPPPPSCGNHVFDTGEQCEDGNNVDGDGCSHDCQLEAGVAGKFRADDQVVNHHTELWCEHLLADPLKKADATCSAQFQICEKQTRGFILEELFHKCGKRIITGPSLATDYLFYCDANANQHIANQGPTVAAQSKANLDQACAEKTDSNGSGSGNSGGANGGSGNGGGSGNPVGPNDGSNNDNGNNAEGVIAGNNVSGGGSESTDGPGLTPGVAVAGGACSLMVTTSSHGAAMSLLIAGIFTLPLLRRKNNS